jgi:outer membrane protein insertion porin family
LRTLVVVFILRHVATPPQRSGSPLFGIGVNSDAGLTGSVLLNERNGDTTRVPTSLDDLRSGRAFRGAGQEPLAQAEAAVKALREAATPRPSGARPTRWSKP